MANVVPVLFVELVVRDGRERLPPERERFFDRETDSLSRALPVMSVPQLSLAIEGQKWTTRLEEETVLLSSFVLEMFARLKGILQLPHAQREALHRELRHHLGRDGLAVGARRKVVVGRDPGQETHRQVRQDRDQSSVFVQPWKGFRRELRTDAGTGSQRLSARSHDWAIDP